MLDKEKIKASFSKSARNYDKHALLQKELADKLFLMLKTQGSRLKTILDIGCGTGYLAAKLAKQFPEAKVVGIDLAPGMIAVAPAGENLSFQVADGESLPLADKSFDLVVSNVSLQWMDAAKVATEVSRVLRPEGAFLFSTFGPATLSEISQAGLSVNKFLAKEELEGILRRHFKQVEITTEKIIKQYNDVFDLFFYLKEIGAQAPERVEGKGLWTKNKIASLFLNNSDHFSATYEVLFGRAA